MPTPNLPPRPPQGEQSFGHGAPSHYHFQYSTCTGRRRALLIGINYFGQPNQLHGCINDVANMARFLHESHGYRREDMVILTDDQTNPMSIPCKANMLRAMQWLVNDAQPNDALFIHFSGRWEPCTVKEGYNVMMLIRREVQATVDGRRIWMATKRMVSVTKPVVGLRKRGDSDALLGYDDVIYPVDYRAVGHIVDDEMHDIL